MERNYDVHDCELLAIIKALEHWKHYLEGTRHSFEIWTDHCNLIYFQTAHDLSRRQARWSLFLSQFDFQLSYKAGTTNHANALSRHLDLGEGVESDNKAQTLLPSKLFSTSSETLINSDEDRHVKATEILSLSLLSLI